MINKLKAYLKEKGSAALIMSEENICYFTSFHSSNGYLLVTGDKAFFLTDSRYIEAAQNKITTCDEILQLKSMEADLMPLIESLGVSVLELESERITVSRYHKIRELVPSASVVCDGALDSAIDEIRIKKNEAEVAKIVKAQRIAERAFDYILTFISTEKTEKEIALELEYFMMKNGADGLSFETICVSGKNSSLPHGVPTDKKIEKGDFITMDYGATTEFYHSDMTRTVAVGEVSSKQAGIYETVLRAQKAGLEAVKCGVNCSDVDAVSRKIIADAGYADYFGHGLGHGVGVEIHELPTLNPTSKAVLEAGHIVTVEPGIYIPGEFGVRIEDMALVTADGCENLTVCEKKLIVL
ncbi:MAG: aminopeptidase P family protein [Ruminococcaceae bacterium]|nr:aminopeptidase P family protein [Oscillospiraceae bacterium]